MKTTNEHAPHTGSFNRAAAVCLASCRKLLRALRQTKLTILNEFRLTLGAHQQMLKLALNEAEALAWETGYPHLVFPLLATEKAQAVAAWTTRQSSIARARSNNARYLLDTNA